MWMWWVCSRYGRRIWSRDRDLRKIKRGLQKVQMSLTIIWVNKVINLLLLGNHLPCLTFIKKHKSRGRNKVVCCIPKVDILILSVGILKTNLKLHKYSLSTVHSRSPQYRVFWKNSPSPRDSFRSSYTTRPRSIYMRLVDLNIYLWPSNWQYSWQYDLIFVIEDLVLRTLDWGLETEESLNQFNLDLV